MKKRFSLFLSLVVVVLLSGIELPVAMLWQKIVYIKNSSLQKSATDTQTFTFTMAEFSRIKKNNTPLETESAEGQGGYAKAQDEAFYRKQRELMARVVAECDVVITTAAIPGKKAPVLVTAEMVRGMMPGSVIVDLAAERGGNCELTRPGEVVMEHGVAIHGPLNLPSSVPHHASQLYAKNIQTFLLHIAKEGKLALDADDQILRETLLTRDGVVVESRVRGLLGLPEAGAPAQEG